MTTPIPTASKVYLDFFLILIVSIVVGFISTFIESPLGPEWNFFFGSIISGAILTYIYYQRFKAKFPRSPEPNGP